VFLALCIAVLAIAAPDDDAHVGLPCAEGAGVCTYWAACEGAILSGLCRGSAAVKCCRVAEDTEAVVRSLKKTYIGGYVALGDSYSAGIGIGGNTCAALNSFRMRTCLQVAPQSKHLWTRTVRAAYSMYASAYYSRVLLRRGSVASDLRMARPVVRIKGQTANSVHMLHSSLRATTGARAPNET
jgi:hypothetical protein